MKKRKAKRLFFSDSDSARCAAAAVNKAVKAFNAGYRMRGPTLFEMEWEGPSVDKVAKIIKSAKCATPIFQNVGLGSSSKKPKPRKSVEEQARSMAFRLGGFAAFRLAESFSERSESEDKAAYWDNVAEMISFRYSNVKRGAK